MLEVSVVVFLLQGYLISGREVGWPAFCCISPTMQQPGAPRPEAVHPALGAATWVGVCAQALIRTLWLSGSYAALETLAAAVYIFGVRIPLFLYG